MQFFSFGLSFGDSFGFSLGFVNPSLIPITTVSQSVKAHNAQHRHPGNPLTYTAHTGERAWIKAISHRLRIFFFLLIISHSPFSHGIYSHTRDIKNRKTKSSRKKIPTESKKVKFVRIGSWKRNTIKEKSRKKSRKKSSRIRKYTGRNYNR